MNTKKMKREKVLFLVIYVVSVIFWLIFNFSTHFSGLYEGNLFYFILKPFLLGMTLLPLIGGIYGIKKSKNWGGFKSFMGKALFFLSLGIIAWACGMVIWNYYLFFTDIEVPYPSLADVIFILSWPLWTLGLYFLSKVIGMKFGLRTGRGKFLVILIPVLAIIFSYYFLFQVARDGQMSFDDGILKLFFDLFYPIGDVIILTATAVIYILSRNFLGGTYRRPVQFLFFGFLLNYCADFIFAYTTTTETYYNGHFADLLYTTAMFVLCFSLNRFYIENN